MDRSERSRRVVDQGAPSEARPRSIGELLDRAVTLAVQNAGPLLLALALAEVPVAVLNALLAPHGGDVWGLMGQLVVARAAGHTAEVARINRELAGLQGGAVTLYVIVVTALLAPLGQTVYFRILAAADAGLPLDFGAALREALPRWLPQLALGLIVIAATVPLILVWALVVFAFVLVGIGVSIALHAATGAAAVFAIVAVVVSSLVGLGMYGLMLLVLSFATISIATETPHAMRAFGAALRRVFDRRSLRRSLLVAVAVIVLSLAGAAAGLALGAGVAAVLHAGILATAIATVVGLGVELIRLAFIAQYSNDVRVRREGRDLALAAAAIEPAGLTV